jgi:hypothetical protein
MSLSFSEYLVAATKKALDSWEILISPENLPGTIELNWAGSAKSELSVLDTDRFLFCCVWSDLLSGIGWDFT